VDHVWRVFENDREFLFKHFRIEGVTVVDTVTGAGEGADNWNVACQGYMTIDRDTSTAVITAQPPQPEGQG